MDIEKENCTVFIIFTYRMALHHISTKSTLIDTLLNQDGALNDLHTSGRGRVKAVSNRLSPRAGSPAVTTGHT